MNKNSYLICVTYNHLWDRWGGNWSCGEISYFNTWQMWRHLKFTLFFSRKICFMTIMRFWAKKNWVKNCAHGEKKWQIWGIGQTLQIVEAEVRYWFELGVQQFEAQMWVWGTVKSKDSVKNIAVPTNGKGQVWYLFELEVWKCVKRYSKEEWGGREPNHCICMASSEWGTNLSTFGTKLWSTDVSVRYNKEQ